MAGALFRTLARIYLEARHDVPRDTLAGILARRLAADGIEYHPRTIRRQILGMVESVPPEVEASLMSLCLEDVFAGDRNALVASLGELGEALSDAEARAPYVAVERLDPLIRLWLLFNRGQSKRALAERLHHDLSQQGVLLTRESIQWKLASNGHLVRREVLTELLGYLGPHGIWTERAVSDYLDEHRATVDAALEGRSLVDAAKFRQYCRLWQIQNREASTRRLALLLRTRLQAEGVRLGIEHLQRSIAGKTPRIRRDLFSLMEQLLHESLPEGETAESLLAKTEWTSPRNLDLAWVRCEPIAELAQEWLQANPGSSMRQLALRVVKTIRRMGYESSHNTIQPILGGWKKRTRGYVFRALLKQFPDRAEGRIPSECFVGSARFDDAGDVRRPGGLVSGAQGSVQGSVVQGSTHGSGLSAPADVRARERSQAPSPFDAREERKRGTGTKVPGADDPQASPPALLAGTKEEADLSEFIDEATRHLSQAKSPLFAKLAALRAEKLYGIPAEDAYATILGRVS